MPPDCSPVHLEEEHKFSWHHNIDSFIPRSTVSFYKWIHIAYFASSILLLLPTGNNQTPFHLQYLPQPPSVSIQRFGQILLTYLPQCYCISAVTCRSQGLSCRPPPTSPFPSHTPGSVGLNHGTGPEQVAPCKYNFAIAGIQLAHHSGDILLAHQSVVETDCCLIDPTIS